MGEDSSAKRICLFDALKFFSMCIVFVTHIMLSFFPKTAPEFHVGNILFPNYLTDGNLAVCMFLLISVYLFVQKAFKSTQNDTIITLFLKRYVRLAIPALIVNISIFVLYSSNLFFNRDFYDASVPFVDTWFDFSNPFSALKKLVWGILDTCLFFNAYNPPLWCYYLLFWLPILVYAVIRLVQDKKALNLLALMFLPFFLLRDSYLLALPLSVLIFNDFLDRKKTIGLCVFVIVACIGVRCIRLNYNASFLDKFAVSNNMFLAASILKLLSFNKGGGYS
ncbi:MAG: acyltransferase family protein [Treponema sp.]|nr:acyltransferase family protein [Treponema sp.]